MSIRITFFSRRHRKVVLIVILKHEVNISAQEVGDG